MTNARALGLVETQGLVAAIEAADAAVKAARVHLVGYELASGGIVTVKVLGDVADVKASVDAGGAAANRVGTLLAVHVIPRPDVHTQTLIPPRHVPGSPAFPWLGVVPSPQRPPPAAGGAESALPPNPPARATLEGMTTQQLRKLARSYRSLPGKEISRSTKAKLIESILGGKREQGHEPTDG